MLRNREIELIAALVEGGLEDETEARALLDRSEEARVEFEAQLVAYEALQAVGPAGLTEHERAGLRREVWTELSRDTSPVSRSKPWFYTLAPVAAALVLVVGVLGVLNRGFQGSDEATDTLAESAGSLLGATTQAAGEDRLEAAADDAAPAAEGDGGADLAAEESAPWVMAPDEFFATIADLVRSGGFTTTQLQRDFDGATGFEDATTCVESAGLTQFELIGEATNIVEAQGEGPATTYLVLIPEGVEPGLDTDVTFVSLTECEVSHVEE